MWPENSHTPLLGLGRTLFNAAEDIYGLVFLKSYLVYLTIEGTTGTSEITAGKSLHDSIESKNVTKKSDFTIQYYLAKVISEEVDGLKVIYELEQDELTRDIVNEIKASVTRFKQKGVSIRGVDVNDKGIRDVVRTNVSIEHMKKSKKIRKKIESKDKTMIEN